MMVIREVAMILAIVSIGALLGVVWSLVWILAGRTR